MRLERGGQLWPVGYRAVDSLHSNVRHQTQDAVAQFAGEPVHDGQHRDKAGHTERHSQQGHHGHYADKAVALATETVRKPISSGSLPGGENKPSPYVLRTGKTVY